MDTSKSLTVGGLVFKYVEQGRPGLGMAVSRAYGCAVERNLFKRRCRSIFNKLIINNNRNIALFIRPIKQQITFSYLSYAFGVVFDEINS